MRDFYIAAVVLIFVGLPSGLVSDSDSDADNPYAVSETLQLSSGHKRDSCAIVMGSSQSPGDFEANLSNLFNALIEVSSGSFGVRYVSEKFIKNNSVNFTYLTTLYILEEETGGGSRVNEFFEEVLANIDGEKFQIQETRMKRAPLRGLTTLQKFTCATFYCLYMSIGASWSETVAEIFKPYGPILTNVGRLVPIGIGAFLGFIWYKFAFSDKSRGADHTATLIEVKLEAQELAESEAYRDQDSYFVLITKAEPAN